MNCDEHLPDALVPRRHAETPGHRTTTGEPADRDRPAGDRRSGLPAALSLRRSTTPP